MKKLLLTFIFLTSMGTIAVYAQEESQILICTMTVDDVLKKDQPFDIDDPIAENAKHIVVDLIAELKYAYGIIDGIEAGDLKISKMKISELQIQAKKLKMNLSMFNDDIEIIEKAGK